MGTTRFALRDFTGKPTAYYRVETETLDTTNTKDVKTPTHHIIGIDASGSMYRDLEDLKLMVEKLLTLEEFNDPTLKVSLVTYSSSGDVRTHFERATVGEVMSADSSQLTEIRNLRVRGLTCISQGLRAAESLIDDAEITCVSIHSDGFANDRSPSAEKRDIEEAVSVLANHPNTFCNTVSYGSWADFNTLSSIANKLSGTCIQAKTPRQVYEAMHDATALLAGNMAPVLEVGAGNADFTIFMSKNANKVLGSTETMAVRGLSTDDDATAYRLYTMTPDQYETSDATEVYAGQAGSEVILAFARTQVAMGNLNAAKYALVGYRDTDLLTNNYRALTTSEVATMCEAIETTMFNTNTTTPNLTDGYGLPTQGPAVLTVLNVLNKHRDAVRINVEKFAAPTNYSRRSLKRVAGTRAEDGTITPPNATLKTSGDRTAVPVNGIEINRNTATINIRVEQDGTLVKNDGTEVNEVEGLTLNLKDYRNYTVVSDGSLNVNDLPVRISDKRCFKALADLGAVTGDFDPTNEYIIGFNNAPLVDFNQSFDVPNMFNDLAQLTVVSKFLSALTTGTSESLTDNQIAALKELHVTPAMYFSPPSTTAYESLDDALSNGLVDTRLSYKVEVGTTDITNVGKLKSGNAYFDRRFTVTDSEGNVIKKPKLNAILDTTNTLGIKTLSARTKLDSVDTLTYPIYAEFLGLETGDTVTNVLTNAGFTTDEVTELFNATNGTTTDTETRVGVFTDALRKVNTAVTNMYTDTISPLVFYVGATGLVPDELGAKMYTADDLAEKYPDTKLAKAEKEDGTFFALPNGLLLTVYIKGEHFTTDAGLAAVAKTA